MIDVKANSISRRIANYFSKETKTNDGLGACERSLLFSKNYGSFPVSFFSPLKAHLATTLLFKITICEEEKKWIVHQQEMFYAKVTYWLPTFLFNPFIYCLSEEVKSLFYIIIIIATCIIIISTSRNFHRLLYIGYILFACYFIYWAPLPLSFSFTKMVVAVRLLVLLLALFTDSTVSYYYNCFVKRHFTNDTLHTFCFV